MTQNLVLLYSRGSFGLRLNGVSCRTRAYPQIPGRQRGQISRAKSERKIDCRCEMTATVWVQKVCHDPKELRAWHHGLPLLPSSCRADQHTPYHPDILSLARAVQYLAKYFVEPCLKGSLSSTLQAPRSVPIFAESSSF
ncbi:hypothetical protein BDW67DRAFT_156924 [Aspergillus spinulosporus]